LLRGSVLFVCLVAGSALLAAPASPQLRTGIMDERYSSTSPGKAMQMTKPTGAKVVRIVLSWHDVAFVQPVDATNPNDEAYFWAHADTQIKAARANGLEPLVTVMRAPNWAHQPNLETPDVTRYPNAAAFGDFAEAAAKRYSGSHVDPDVGPDPLPRVRYWMAWNEPNRRYFLLPQMVGTTVVSAEIYRDLVNEFADGVRAADSDEDPNLVIAGGLAPLGITGSPSPMRFMRTLLADGEPPVKFDVWSHHPYTSGGPTHKAAGSGNIALGNLPTMRRYLNNRFRAGRIDTPRSKVQFWVTEFGWDTKPPDKHRYALPTGLHARWTSEALYRMWRHGVTLVTWFKLRDNPFKLSRYQSGLYTKNWARKRSFRAFRFPTVAFRRPGGISVWGRTPKSAPGKVVLQVRIGTRWRRLTTLQANANGIFRRSMKTPYRNASIRARHGGETSLGFSLTPVPNRYVNPFGCGGGSSCT
jgi:hypothetical protein